MADAPLTNGSPIGTGHAAGATRGDGFQDRNQRFSDLIACKNAHRILEVSSSLNAARQLLDDQSVPMPAAAEALLDQSAAGNGKDAAAGILPPCPTR